MWKIINRRTTHICVIVELLPGVSVPYFQLDNAVNNNEDGYGLVIKHKDRLEVIKDCPAGGSDPVEIQKLLEKHKKSLRYLHLRHRTEGTIDLENCHPYTVYNQDGVHIEFAHNGTMYEYAPKKEIKLNNVITQEADPRSDSKIFVDTVLIPLFKNLRGADYTEEFISKYIGKMWPVTQGNRGLLISNKYPTMLLNSSEWKTIKANNSHGQAVEFRASNDTYFDTLSRGRLFDELKRKKEAEEAAKRIVSFPQTQGPYQHTGGSSFSWSLTKLKDVDLKPNDFLGTDLCDILADFDLYEDKSLAALSNLTEAELLTLCQTDPNEATGLLLLITRSFTKLYEGYEKLEQSHVTASNLVGQNVAKIKTLEGIISKMGRELTMLNTRLKDA